MLHLDGARATELAVKVSAPGSRVVHLATHGFFAGEDCEPAADDAARGMSVGLGEPRPSRALVVENPLLHSGLALAGANRRGSAGPDEQDGVLTAEEVATLDLSACEWAVLSACGTGVGTVQAGEGVMGLQRAFALAGAGTVVMSLWSVDDEAARAWMSELYRARLVRGLDTAECVREASLAVLHDRRGKGLDDSPFWWGAFVASGDWR